MSNTTPPPKPSTALNDFVTGLKSRLWWELSVHDIKARYRRTVLGPWWITLGTGIALTGIGVVWSTIFGVDLEDLFPYLTSGYVIWMMLASFLAEGCATFTNASSANLQRNFVLPKSVHVFRQTSRTIMAFFHNIIIFIIAAIIFKTDINMFTLLIIPSLFMLA